MATWYEERTAVDPVTGGADVDGVGCQLFDYTDSDYVTPLIVTDINGLSLDKILSVRGRFPGFFGPGSESPTGGHVRYKTDSGDVGVWEAWQGVRDSAEAARDAAEAAADTVAGAVAGAVFGITAGANVTVDNTDPQHPVVSATGGGGGGGSVDSVVAGANVTVDATDPAHPVVSADFSADVEDVSGLQAALDGKANSTHQHTASQISDSGATGRDVVKAATPAAARTATGAGQVNSVVAGANVTVDNTDPTAPVVNVDGSVVGGDWNSMANKPAVIAAGGTATEARTAIGAGTSSFSGAYADLTGKPTIPGAASTSTSGTVELATTAETVAGTDTSRAVTPAGVQAALIDAPISNEVQAAIDIAAASSNITMYGSGWVDTRPEGVPGVPRTWDDTAKALADGANTAGPTPTVLVEGDYWRTYRYEVVA